MRIGQTSAIQFVSKVVTSAGGFLATLYFARIVGSDTLGIYFILLSSVGWLSVLVDAGISPAITKRMSEGEAPAEYFQVGLGVIGVGTGAITFFLLLFSKQVTDYITHPYSTYFLIVLVISGTAMTAVRTGLSGTQNVHISGILTSIQSIIRIVLQVAAVSIGLGLSGLVFGWVLSSLVAAAVGLVYLMVKAENFLSLKQMNTRERLIDIYSFAKYSWLGSLKSKTNNYADILILGLFVPSNLIGVYAIAWNIASFLTILGSAIETTLFPEFSELENQDDYTEIAHLLQKSLQYTGLFVIPGLFGGILLGDRILRLYGSNFVIGFEVLILLIVSVLIYDYQKQLTGVLQGIDRPDIDFRVNGTFIGSNIILNLILIQQIGWYGAAIATVLSSGISLVYAYYAVCEILPVSVPVREIGKQIGASIIMAISVFLLEAIESAYTIVGHNALVVFGLVFVGATIYMGTLMTISDETRKTIFDNLPIS
ncbi:transporter [Halorubrum sp. BOL3-1]|uniref:oligosaccharide flippase family protein n=1 Tax=Halorubrum sp. BOL3-1 TaxID=2497325 RepID=UPI001004F17E|nr:polysaccharide biosynthesis C-terminal domain-containing protein [Halorubrum sp. BOL3-1]QAU12253.1 transporter [Halorubrum sp. BOL3-1]